MKFRAEHKYRNTVISKRIKFWIKLKKRRKNYIIILNCTQISIQLQNAYMYKRQFKTQTNSSKISKRTNIPKKIQNSQKFQNKFKTHVSIKKSKSTHIKNSKRK